MKVIFECSFCESVFDEAQKAVNCCGKDFNVISKCCGDVVSSYEGQPEKHHCYSCGRDVQPWREQTVLWKGNWHLFKRDGSFPQITERVKKIV